MHEATVALAILKRATETVEKRMNRDAHGEEDTIHVSKIVLQIGEFRNIDSESLEFSFSALRKDFPMMETTELEIKEIKAIALCSNQNHEFHAQPVNYFSCTTCGGGIGKLLTGKELDIINIEMEQRSSVSTAR